MRMRMNTTGETNNMSKKVGCVLILNEKCSTKDLPNDVCIGATDPVKLGKSPLKLDTLIIAGDVHDPTSYSTPPFISCYF